MQVTAVHARFFRAFNVNHLARAKADPGDDHDPWDTLGERFLPYVTVPIDAEVTCIVGANESGKSQLLKITRQALLDDTRDPADFCPYSDEFTVSEQLKKPHVGVTLEYLTPTDRDALNSVPGITGVGLKSTVRLFRQAHEHVDVFVDDAHDSLEVDDMAKLESVLPRVLEIDSKLRLPDAVPIDFLVNAATSGESPIIRSGVAGSIAELLRKQPWIATSPIQEPSDKDALALGKEVVRHLRRSPEPDDEQLEQYRLAYKLLVTCGGVDPTTFEAIRTMNTRPDRKAFVGALEHDINRQLEESLNLASWWTQDDRFRVSVKVREFEIALMISDRTDFEYSFDERSSGLRYFLSYLVQYFSHLKGGERDGRHEVLLMDEPDAYLSNAAQQDLLRLFQHFADGASPARSQQVVYVTHSPFLIDKNRPGRVRVLDKGFGEQGTRLVGDTSRNHFEPLRSAFGGFVAETVYIGHCNLIMEGSADHVYLANLSRILLKRTAPESDRLDLNSVTLVPAGSAKHVCYLTYLARGRDASQPSVVVLLDGDGPGLEAADSLKKQKIDGVKTIPSDLILILNDKNVPGLDSERPNGPLEIEDLIPTSVAAMACSRYALEIGLHDPQLRSDDIGAHLAADIGIIDAAASALEAGGSDLRLDKVPFALHVVGVLQELGAETIDLDPVSMEAEPPPAVATEGAGVTPETAGQEGGDAHADTPLDGPDDEALAPDPALPTPAVSEALTEDVQRCIRNFAVLFRRLTALQRLADHRRFNKEVIRRTDRAVRSFLRDNTEQNCTKVRLKFLIEELEHGLDDSLESEAIRSELRTLEVSQSMKVDLEGPVVDFNEVSRRLAALSTAGTRASQEDA